jgi:hypothetical protein
MRKQVAIWFCSLGGALLASFPAERLPAEQLQRVAESARTLDIPKADSSCVPVCSAANVRCCPTFEVPSDRGFVIKDKSGNVLLNHQPDRAPDR